MDPAAPRTPDRAADSSRDDDAASMVKERTSPSLPSRTADQSRLPSRVASVESLRLNEKAAEAGDLDGWVATGTATAEESELSRQATAKSRAGTDLAKIDTREDGSEYPRGIKLVLIVIALCLAVFLMALDNSIIATAIPKITAQFHSVDDVGWYGSAYLLTASALQLLFGRVYTFYSIKWVFLAAIFIFEVGSLICGVANSSLTLIIGRAVAGIGSSAIFSGALIILAYSVPLAKRPLYTGLVGAMYGIASVAGPLLGGVFTDKVTWRWCFYVNLPIGAVSMVAIVFLFSEPRRQTTVSEPWRQRVMRFDPVGTAVFMPGIICLLLALQWGGTTYAWSSWRVILLFCLFGVLIAIFLVVQLRQQERATVPPRILRMRTVWSSAFYAFCIGAGFLGSIYFLPIWFQAVKGASAVHSGIMNLPMLISCVLLSILAGGLITKLGYYTPFMLAGVVFSAIGYGLLSTMHPDTSSGKWIGYQILAGAGIGLGMQQPLIAVQTVLEMADVPTGTAIIIFAQTLGGALFVAVGETLFENKLVQYTAEFAPSFGDPSQVLKLGASSIQSSNIAYRAGLTLAYNNALTQTFIVFAAMCAASIIGAVFVEWKSVKGKKIEMMA